VHEAKKSGAKSITVWGTGTPRREFLHTDDLADACVFLLDHYDQPDLVNIGCGEDVTIRELAETVCDVLGFDGALEFDSSKPDGTPRKLLDISKITSLGWSPKIALRDGIADAYRWFVKNQSTARR
jgi:GDP-L-fucose synthase